MLCRVSLCRDRLGVGGGGNERVLRARQGRGNHKDKVVMLGKDRGRGGQRHKSGIWEMEETQGTRGGMSRKVC